MNYKVTFEIFGEQGILVNWPMEISAEINNAVLQTDAFINENFSEEIIETVPTYRSIAIYVKTNTSLSAFLQKLKKATFSIEKPKTKGKSLLSIPVCYRNEFAPDLKQVAKIHNISTAELIKLHSNPRYKVYFLGFLPGFPYLGGLDERLRTPRKNTPRKYIEKGSVAIGANQTGIYTMDSPGGWNIIGKSPLQFFASEKKPFSLLKPGDYLKFQAVTLKEFRAIEKDVTSGNYRVEREVYHD